jgi:alanine racemase
MRPTKAIIDLAAITHNLALIRQFAPKCKVAAVIKADAYGHGLVQVAKALEAADAVAVACLDEAVALRAAGVKLPILLLEGFFDDAELEQIFELNLDSVIHQKSQLDALLAYSARKTEQPDFKSHLSSLNIWLKLDTGMNRLGFEIKDFKQTYSQLKACDLVGSVKLMSHLACADDIQSSQTQAQIKAFNQSCQGIECERSMANSAGIIAWPEAHYDWVRPGIALFGCSPMQNYVGTKHQLQPVMNLESRLFAIRNISKGQSVGYGANWVASQDTIIGTVAIGYGDGYPRHAKQGTPVYIKGKCYPLVGRVSMDMLSVDLGQPFVEPDSLSNSHEIPAIGERVVLWGKELAVEVVAAHADTIPYTLLCGVTSRVNYEWR